MPYFPRNIIDELVERLATIDGVVKVVRRAPKDSDASCTVGVVHLGRRPIDKEIGGRGTALSAYRIAIAVIVRGVDREPMEELLQRISKSVWTMVETDSALETSFGEMLVTSGGSTERIHRLDVVNQRLGAVDTRGSGHFAMSVTEIDAVTETVHS